MYPLAGPIYVNSAEPGDILEVDILRLEPLKWGWAGIIPGLGLLAEDFNQPYIRHFDLSNGVTAPLRDDIQIPIQPFCGTMGVATDEDGALDVLPPTQRRGQYRYAPPDRRRAAAFAGLRAGCAVLGG